MITEPLLCDFINNGLGAVQRSTVKPGTPPDFILKVTIDRHPVRFFVHKRPHVDFFLNIVSYDQIKEKIVSCNFLEKATQQHLF